jgi:hypothetical protein
MIRLRPRYSIRTLGIAVTLICSYFGAWEATKRYGLAPRLRHAKSLSRTSVWLETESRPLECQLSCPLPLVIAQDEYFVYLNGLKPGTHRRYYLWLFGPQWKLPWESEWEDELVAAQEMFPGPPLN